MQLGSDGPVWSSHSTNIVSRVQLAPDNVSPTAQGLVVAGLSLQNSREHPTRPLDCGSRRHCSADAPGVCLAAPDHHNGTLPPTTSAGCFLLLEAFGKLLLQALLERKDEIRVREKQTGNLK